MFKHEKTPAPKNRPFLASDGKNFWVSKYYSDTEGGHPINGKLGYQPVVCDCCERDDLSKFEFWDDLPHPANSDSQISFMSDKNEESWVMRITDGKIKFNRTKYPNVAEDEFAEAVLQILERADFIQLKERESKK